MLLLISAAQAASEVGRSYQTTLPADCDTTGTLHASRAEAADAAATAAPAATVAVCAASGLLTTANGWRASLLGRCATVSPATPRAAASPRPLSWFPCVQTRLLPFVALPSYSNWLAARPLNAPQPWARRERGIMTDI